MNANFKQSPSVGLRLIYSSHMTMRARGVCCFHGHRMIELLCIVLCIAR